jgi:hypothetical protein
MSGALAACSAARANPSVSIEIGNTPARPRRPKAANAPSDPASPRASLMT